MENLQGIRPQPENSEIIDLGLTGEIGNMLITKLKEEKGDEIEITPEIEKKATQFVSQSQGVTLRVPTNLEISFGNRPYNSLDGKKKGNIIHHTLSTVKETRFEEYSQGVEGEIIPSEGEEEKQFQSSSNSDEIIKQNDEFNKKQLNKFYKGFLQILDLNKINSAFDTPRFELEKYEEKKDIKSKSLLERENSSEKKGLKDNAKTKSLLGDDNSDDPNKNSTPFTYSKTTQMSTGGQNLKLNSSRIGVVSQGEQIKNLEGIVVNLRKELEFFRDYVKEREGKGEVKKEEYFEKMKE